MRLYKYLLDRTKVLQSDHYVMLLPHAVRTGLLRAAACRFVRSRTGAYGSVRPCTRPCVVVHLRADLHAPVQIRTPACGSILPRTLSHGPVRVWRTGPCGSGARTRAALGCDFARPRAASAWFPHDPISPPWFPQCLHGTCVSGVYRVRVHAPFPGRQFQRKREMRRFPTIQGLLLAPRSFKPLLAHCQSVGKPKNPV